MKNSVYAQTQTDTNYKFYSNITPKQWKVYYYLLSISLYDSDCNEDHRFVYKKNFNKSAAADFLQMSRPTIYSSIKALEKIGLIKELERSYSVYSKEWVEINRDVLHVLIGFNSGNQRNIDLLRTYLLLKKIDKIAHFKEDRKFTKRSIVKLLGHDTRDSSYYDDVSIYLSLLTFWEMIELTSETAYDEGLGRYTIYTLKKVDESKITPNLISDIAAEMENDEMPERVFDKLMFIMPQLVEDKIKE